MSALASLSLAAKYVAGATASYVSLHQTTTARSKRLITKMVVACGLRLQTPTASFEQISRAVRGQAYGRVCRVLCRSSTTSLSHSTESPKVWYVIIQPLRNHYIKHWANTTQAMSFESPPTASYSTVQRRFRVNTHPPHQPLLIMPKPDNL